MATIHYNITLDDEGNATVTQDVITIDANDRIRFTSNIPRTAILFEGDSPFGAEILEPDRVFPVMDVALPALPVKKSNQLAFVRFVPQFQQERQTFHFQVGQVDTNGNFTLFEGQGGFVPEGGSPAPAGQQQGRARRKPKAAGD